MTPSLSLFPGVQCLFLFALLFATSAFGQVTNLNLGNLAPGESVTVIYDVTINNTLPPTLQGITNQAAVSATGVATANSDDPKTGALNDPTVTPLVQTAFAATVAATSVGPESATLNGLVNPGGDTAGYYFEFGTNIATAARTITNTLAASYATSAVNIAVSGLLPNTVYQFRILATNSLALVSGSYLSFTTTVFSIVAQPASRTACIGDSALFTVSVNAPGSANYQWQRRDPGAGGFNNLIGANSSSYNLPLVAAADDGATYRVIASAPGTNLTTSEAVLSVISLPTPTVTFDFNTGLPPNTAIYGSAFPSNGILELNTNVPGQYGTFLTADLAPGRLVRGFSAFFRVNMVLGGGSGSYADGFSFDWANDLPHGLLIGGEEGDGSGLRVCFDTYDNGLGEAPAIDVKWGTNTIGHYATDNSFLPGAPGEKNVEIRLNTDGTLDMTFACRSIFARLPIPGYTPLINARFGLGSRTGGAWESHSIDDFLVQLSVDPTNGVPQLTRVTNQPPTNVVIVGTGNPGQNVALLAATNITNTFTWRANVTPNSNGVFTFVENTTGIPYRFYRLNGAAQFPSNLVTWYRAESNYLDSFGGNNGSSTNLGFAAGQRGPAFNFNATNQNMLIGGAAIPVPWTAAFWVKRQDAPGLSAALLTSPTSGLKLEQTATARLVGFTAFGLADYSFNYSAPTNVWTHLAFVAAPGSTVLYTNGVAAGTNVNTVSLPLNILGARENGADQLRGLVDETMLFNRALTPAEIQQVLNATRGP